MNSNFIDDASKVIHEPQILINMVSKRVRQLSAGSHPMVPVEGRMGLADIALAEIAQGKLTVSTAESGQGGEKQLLPERALMSAEIVTNRKALRDYHILERIEAGLELRGTEVKSIRAGLVNLQGAFARIEGREMFLYDGDIQPYERASHEQHEPKRRRKLLLHRQEILKLAAQTEQAGCTLVALRLYWKNSRVKVELGVGKGKVAADKRADLKKRVQQRETDRLLANIQRKRQNHPFDSVRPKAAIAHLLSGTKSTAGRSWSLRPVSERSVFLPCGQRGLPVSHGYFARMGNISPRDRARFLTDYWLWPVHATKSRNRMRVGDFSRAPYRDAPVGGWKNTAGEEGETAAYLLHKTGFFRTKTRGFWRSVA